MKNVGAPPDCPRVAMTTGRRSLLKGAAGALIELTVLRRNATAQDDPLSIRPKAGDVLVRATDPAATPLTVADVPPGKPLMAWPMDPADRVVRKGTRFNQVLVVRLDPARLSADTRARAAEGIVAYTTICTHSGCDVVELTDDQLLLCPCHSSTFDPRDGARVTDGPAPRSLPALPLAISNGTIVVAGPFTDRVGFEQA
jgi:Rieske Fe-S protein